VLLTSRNVLITGASSGIGLALCRQLVANGATVFPTGKRQITDLAGYMPADLSQQAGRDLLTGHLEQETDHIDVAIYNAGILGSPQVALRDYEERTWRSVLELNVTAIQLLHQRLDSLLTASGHPTVIVTSSSVGRRGRAGWGAYSVAKHAIEGWVAVLADEWGGVGRVYSVNPGGTATPMRAAAFPDEDQDSLPTGDDIAPVFLYLSREDCPAPTGTRLNARDWIGLDPQNGLQIVQSNGMVTPSKHGEIP
jgi:NAD(P)-dependent dehydrogenase (short-subunit alcohol dehydrogenase family)